MRRHRRSGSVLLLVAILAIGTGAQAGGAVAKEPGSRDITATARGKALATGAVDRFADRGVQYEASDLVVIDYGSAGTMVVPAGTTVLGLGSAETTPVKATSSEAVPAAGSVTALAAAPDGDWSRMAGACLARHYETGGYMDACWALYKETSDGSSTYDWWGLHFFGTMATPTAGYWVGNGYVQAYRSGGPAQTWAYWDPRSELTGSCHAVELNFLGGIFGFDHQVCERWTYSKENPTVSMRTTYHGNADGTREVAETLTVRVAQGASSPVFGLNWDMGTCRYPNPCP